jgi:hypothetical protein
MGLTAVERTDEDTIEKSGSVSEPDSYRMRHCFTYEQRMRLLHEVPSSLFENIDYFLKWSPKTTSYNFPRFLNHDAQYGSRLVDELIQIYKTYGPDATIPEWKDFRMSLIESDTIHISFHDIYREKSYDRSYIQAFISAFMTYRVSGYRQCISIIKSDEWSSEEKLAMAIILYYLPDECHMNVMDFS